MPHHKRGKHGVKAAKAVLASQRAAEAQHCGTCGHESRKCKCKESSSSSTSWECQKCKCSSSSSSSSSSSCGCDCHSSSSSSSTCNKCSSSSSTCGCSSSSSSSTCNKCSSSSSTCGCSSSSSSSSCNKCSSSSSSSSCDKCSSSSSSCSSSSSSSSSCCKPRKCDAKRWWATDCKKFRLTCEKVYYCKKCKKDSHECGCGKEKFWVCKVCWVAVEDCCCKKGKGSKEHRGSHAQREQSTNIEISQLPRDYSPLAHRVDSSYVYAVSTEGHSSKAGKILHLYVGRKYHFKISHNGEQGAFMFTTDPIGGAGASSLPGAPSPSSDGTITLEVTKDLPPFFYYQSAYHSMNGGLVVVHGLH